MRSRNKYVKLEGDTYIYFMYTTFDTYDCFPSQFSYGIGFKSLQVLLQKSIGDLYLNQENDFPPVIGIGQAELYESGNYHILEYEISTEEDAIKMVDEVMNYLEKDALPYFESIDTIEKIEPLVNAVNNPRQAVIIGLVLAKMVGNTKYPQLKEMYRNLLKNWTAEEKKKLETAIIFLDNHTAEELRMISIKL